MKKLVLFLVLFLGVAFSGHAADPFSNFEVVDDGGGIYHFEFDYALPDAPNVHVALGTLSDSESGCMYDFNCLHPACTGTGNHYISNPDELVTLADVCSGNFQNPVYYIMYDDTIGGCGFGVVMSDVGSFPNPPCLSGPTCTMTFTPSPTPTPCSPSAPGLRMQYLVNGSLSDTSGNGFPDLVNNGAVGTTVIDGQTYYGQFSGAQGLSMSAESLCDAETWEQMSMKAKIYLNQPPTGETGGYIFHMGGPSTDNTVDWFVNALDDVWTTMRANNAAFDSSTIGGAHNYLLTVNTDDPAVATIYMDGTQVAQGDFGSIFTDIRPISFGIIGNDNGQDLPLSGYVADVELYNVVITPEVVGTNTYSPTITRTFTASPTATRTSSPTPSATPTVTKTPSPTITVTVGTTLFPNEASTLTRGLTSTKERFLKKINSRLNGGPAPSGNAGDAFFFIIVQTPTP